MSIIITPLGGFGEVGRNCVSVEYNGKIILLDMGFHLERFINLTKDHHPSKKHSTKKLISQGAFPDIRCLRRRRNDVVGIICSHAHLDHIGAVPFLAKYFSSPVYGTPFTTSVINTLCEDNKIKISLITKPTGSTINFAHGISVEFIHVAHSTPDSTILAIHTPEGIIIYGNDYKNDQSPPHEKPTDMKRISELQGKVKLLMLDCLYAPYAEHAPSEKTIREELLATNLNSHRAIITTTFSSNISRLITLCDMADEHKREIIFLGRSLSKYIDAAKDINLIDLTTRGTIIKYSKQINKFLQRIESPEKYFIICTGHQGEEQAVLSRMANGLFSFNKKDIVLFSSRVIPTEINQRQRRVLEKKLECTNIIKDKHVSGHGAGLDHDELIKLLKPEFVAPSHGELPMMEAFKKRSQNLGYKTKNVLFLKIGEKYQLS